MNTTEIARTLINMSLDMDYMDYANGNTAEEVNLVVNEVNKLKADDSVLYHLLLSIAEQNHDVRDLLSQIELFEDELSPGTNVPNLQKEWVDYGNMTREIIKAWDKWYPKYCILTHGSGRNSAEIFGFPYTSTSDYAGLWNCQATAELRDDREWRFEGLHYGVDGSMYASFEHEDGTPETLDRRYYLIG